MPTYYNYKEYIKPNGERFETKIGEDGKAFMERHYTDHGRSDKHSNPHDHKIDWDNPQGFPDPGPPINYPDGAPEFKSFEGSLNMSNKIIGENSLEENRFKTISDFKWCMKYHGEVEFEWNNKVYYITHPDGVISISEEGKYLEAKDYETADEALEYMVGEDRLRDVITKVTVWNRTI